MGSLSAHRIVAIDGLSLAGKSTIVGMLNERSSNAQIIRENTFDPHREATAHLNKELRSTDDLKDAVRKAAVEFPASAAVLSAGLEFSQDYAATPKQALLAYLFAAGRKVVDLEVRRVVRAQDVILDRWQVTGWAYQVDPPSFTWRHIRDLNESLGITLPDVQVILTCGIDQIPLRKAFREKETAGTAGQMSGGREQIILAAFREIFDYLEASMPIIMVENRGAPTPELVEQIAQAVPTYQMVEDMLRGAGFALRSEVIDMTFWSDPERLERINSRQSR